MDPEDLTAALEYERGDDCDGSYPMWIFFVKDVSTTYGAMQTVIPPDQRADFLATSHDRGQQYLEYRSRLVDERDLNKYAQERGKLDGKILAFLDQIDVPVPESIAECVRGQGSLALVETVCGIVSTYRSSKTKSKSLRQQWKDIKGLMETLVLSKGIKLAKYLVLSKEISSVYSYPDKGYTLNTHFEDLLDKYARVAGQYKSERHWITKTRQQALQSMNRVLTSPSTQPRIGRFFKRWSDLNGEQKDERIKEYLDHVAKDLDVDATWVADKLDRVREIGVDDLVVKWGQRLGLVQSIPGLVLDGGPDSFRTKPKKKVKWDMDHSASGSSRPPTRSVGRSSRPKRTTSDSLYKLTADDHASLHRILLECLVVQGRGKYSSKDAVIDNVCRQYSRVPVVQASARAYAADIFDEFCETIVNAVGET
ncbi:hypothetical protein GGF32_002711 [Allomyces javanicus]|nr:hypothetical protein GGF32_002711 [Allomyces javanicus]